MDKTLIEQLEQRKKDLEIALKTAQVAQRELRGRLSANMETQLQIKGAYDEIVRILASDPALASEQVGSQAE